jgi:hypothetical protein
MRRRDDLLDSTAANTLAVRFLRSAQLCRARDLEQLSVLTDLVKTICELIHALQKERGTSSIYLGSNGSALADQLVERVADSRNLQDHMRDQAERLHKKLAPINCSARLYTRIACAFRALESLPEMRERVSGLALAPQDALKAFTDIIALLMAVGLEAADVAVDPEISRALVAFVTFAHGKECAGQERATGGVALSRGQLDAADRRQLHHLQSAQDHAFKVFSEFADPRRVATFLELSSSPETAELERVRACALECDAIDRPPAVTTDKWYNITTRRMDSMRGIEIAISDDLARLCATKLAEIKARAKRVDAIDFRVVNLTVPFAMLVTDVDAAVKSPGLAEGVEFFGVGNGLPRPVRSILDVVEVQSRRIDEIKTQLESARTALTERKMIERAKGVLMRERKLPEKEAYAFLRHAAMSQNKRIVEVAEAVIGAADRLGR